MVSTVARDIATLTRLGRSDYVIRPNETIPIWSGRCPRCHVFLWMHSDAPNLEPLIDPILRFIDPKRFAAPRRM